MLSEDEEIAQPADTVARETPGMEVALQALTRLEQQLDYRFDILEKKCLGNAVWTFAAQVITLAAVLALLAIIFAALV